MEIQRISMVDCHIPDKNAVFGPLFCLIIGDRHAPGIYAEDIHQALYSDKSSWKLLVLVLPQILINVIRILSTIHNRPTCVYYIHKCQCKFPSYSGMGNLRLVGAAMC